MTIYDENPSIISSRNAEDIRLGVDSGDVTLAISHNGPQVYQFNPVPNRRLVYVRLSEILRSIRPQAFANPQAIDILGFADIHSVTITASDSLSTETLTKKVFDGGYEAGAYADLVAGTHFWTWRDQISRTYRSGAEYIGGLRNVQAGVECCIYADLHYSDGSEASVKIFSHTPLASGHIFCAANVSYSQVYNPASGKELLWYDVRTEDPNSYKHRFLVSDSALAKCFVFRNTLGLFDTVYALGQVSGSVDGETLTFIGGVRSEVKMETEIWNGYRERIEVNTGPQETPGEKMLWEDFFKSDERYVYEDGELRRIVVDKVNLKLIKRKGSSSTFTYHYAEDPKGHWREETNI